MPSSPSERKPLAGGSFHTARAPATITWPASWNAAAWNADAYVSLSAVGGLRRAPGTRERFAVRFIAYPREGRVEEFVEDVGFEPLVAVR